MWRSWWWWLLYLVVRVRPLLSILDDSSSRASTRRCRPSFPLNQGCIESDWEILTLANILPLLRWEALLGFARIANYQCLELRRLKILRCIFNVSIKILNFNQRLIVRRFLQIKLYCCNATKHHECL